MQRDMKHVKQMFCAICKKQVDLQSVELDARGKTVHRECHEFLYAVSLDEQDSLNAGRSALN